MTIASAIASAALRVSGERLGFVFSNDRQIAVELADLSNEVAADVAASHQWQALTRIAALTGDGTATAFDLPADYGRMLTMSGVQKAGSWLWDYNHVASMDDWLTRLNGGFVGISNAWIITGGQIHFNPAPTGTANFPYISSYWARAEDGTVRGQFERDDDTFILPERLITLGLVWRWREQKGLEYAEDLRNYEVALSQYQTRDGGPTVIRRHSGVGRPLNVGTAWPWELGY